jgi:copper(I)-binding protein
MRGPRPGTRISPPHLTALLAAALVTAGSCGGDEPDVRAVDPAVGASEGGSAALYVDLANTGDHELRLTGARCDCAETTTLHVSEDLDGVVMMTAVDSLALPVDENVELHPGGSHIMLEGLHGPLRAGSTVEVTLEVDRREPIELEVPVVALETLNERVPR